MTCRPVDSSLLISSTVWKCLLRTWGLLLARHRWSGWFHGTRGGLEKLTIEEAIAKTPEEKEGDDKAQREDKGLAREVTTGEPAGLDRETTSHGVRRMMRFGYLLGGRCCGKGGAKGPRPGQGNLPKLVILSIRRKRMR